MALLRVDISGVRNLHPAQLQLSSSINVITGDNASGKTSLLEAVYILGHGKSFRSHHIKEVINHEAAVLQLFGVVAQDERKTPIGIERERKGRPNIKISGQLTHRISELVQLLPLQIMTPDSHSLIESSPAERRSYIDWGVFHVEHSYIELWQKYRHTLKQRNAALRSHQYDRKMDRFWVGELTKDGEAIGKKRAVYIERLLPYLQEYLGRIVTGLDISVDLNRGWPAGSELGELLEQGYERDRSHGFTQYGPHRADMRVKVDGKPAAQVLSRGQQKLVVCAMKLAQVGLLNQNQAKQCTILVDDLPAELDECNRRQLFELLSTLENQIFITATDPSLIQFSGERERRMFHVEQGRISSS